MSKLMIKQQRADLVNKVVQVIASHGLRFFCDKESGRVARVEVDERGKVWWIDDYTGKRVYTHRAGFSSRWKGFSHGGTLRSLVEAFRDYICTGRPLHPGYLGPEGSWTDGNIWGYPPEDMQRVREEAGALPVFGQAGDQP